jgi:hypothetical protein
MGVGTESRAGGVKCMQRDIRNYPDEAVEGITLELVKRNTSTGKVLGGIAVSVHVI